MTAAPEPDLAPARSSGVELRSIRQGLQRDFPDFQPAVIDHWLAVEAGRFDGCRITTFVPILVDKNVRARLRQFRTSG